jgi:signal transduction histidine kinase
VTPLARLRRWLALPPAVEASALAEFNLASMLRGTAAFLAVVAVAWFVLGWRGWLQHTVELWVAYAVAFMLLTWLRGRSGAWIATVPLLLVVLAGPLFGAALAAPLAFLPSLPEERSAAALTGQMGVAFLFALALTLAQLSFGLVLQRQRRQAETRQRALVLERELLASRLAVLQAQIEPHFLYNTLANVQALSRKDAAGAEQMLTHLIEYLRSAMPAMRSTSSTLEREFKLAHAYLSIMQFRMGERLRFSVQADDALLALEFPPTIVGTLIENAIKHGLEPSKTGGSIDVRAWHEGSGLVVEVADTGIGFSASAGSGVGLANARERLVMLYGPTAELDLSLNQLTGVVARARIPVALPPPAAAASTATPTGRDDSTTASTAADILT